MEAAANAGRNTESRRPVTMTAGKAPVPSTGRSVVKKRRQSEVRSMEDGNR